MRIATLTAGAVLALGLMAATAPSQAAPGVPHISSANSQLIQVHDNDGDREEHHGWRRWNQWNSGFVSRRQVRDYDGDGDRRGNACHSVRHECSEEHSAGSWRFNRCVRRHGC